MATAVFNSETITLLDGSTLDVKPLSLKNRRKFMKEWRAGMDRQQESLESNENKESELFDDTSAEDDLLKLIPYCVPGQRPEWEKVWSVDEAEVEEAIDALAEALDEDTLFYIIKQAAGIDLKAMYQTAIQAMVKDESDGTN